MWVIYTNNSYYLVYQQVWKFSTNNAYKWSYVCRVTMGNKDEFCVKDDPRFIATVNVVLTVAKQLNLPIEIKQSEINMHKCICESLIVHCVY